MQKHVMARIGQGKIGSKDSLGYLIGPYLVGPYAHIYFFKFVQRAVEKKGRLLITSQLLPYWPLLAQLFVITAVEKKGRLNKVRLIKDQ